MTGDISLDITIACTIDNAIGRRNTPLHNYIARKFLLAYVIVETRLFSATFHLLARKNI